jgi:phage terminase large subunit GpA-like protein
MDAFTDPEVEEIDVMSGSQVAKSTAIQNMIGYCIDQDPGPAMYVVPREKDVDYATQKIYKPMINLSPALRSHTTGKPRDLLGDFFTFDRMTLYFAWAGSPAEMAQKAIRYLFFDEPDKFPPFAGREANPIDLAEKRTRTFWDRKIVKMCTPTTVEGYIYSSFLRSNKQRFFCPCPRCGEYRLWKFAQLKIPKMLRDPDEIIEKADVWYECEVCAEKIYEDRKGELVAEGLWLPEGQTIDADGNIKGRPKRSKRHSGFQVSAFVSPFPGVSWPRIMADWFKANTTEGIALGKLLDFHNATLGEPFREMGKKLKASQVRKRGS